MRKRFASFEEFYPFYLEEHSKKLTRCMHYGGTLLGYSVGAFGVFHYVLDGHPRHLWYLAAAPLVAYGVNWFSHFFVEGNAPASFKWPVWSTIGDHKMMLGALLSLFTTRTKVLDKPVEESSTV